MTRQIGCFVVLAVGLMAFATTAYAQIDDLDPRRAAFYRHVEPGQATMQVRVWGDVTLPGLYEVQAGTDLLELLFLAGGPGGGVGRFNERQTTSLQLTRRTNGVWNILFEADLDDLATRQQPYPALQDGDALRIDVKVSRPFSWRDAFTVVAAVGTIALVIDRLARVTDR